MAETPAEQLERAIQCHQQGQLQEAEQAYIGLLDSGIETPTILHLLGTVLLQQNRHQDAIERLEAAQQLDPDSAETHNNLGIAYHAQQDWERAARHFEACLKLQPENVQALFNLGQVMRERQLLRDAAKCFERAVELAPDQLEIGLALIDASLESDDLHTAEREMGRLERATDQEGVSYELIRRRALIRLLTGDAEAAEADYRQLLDAAPDDLGTLNNLAIALSLQAQWDAASQFSERALQQESSEATWSTQGRLLRLRGEFDAACRAFEKAAALSDIPARSHLSLGITQLQLSQFRSGWTGLAAYPSATAQRTFPADREWRPENRDTLPVMIHADLPPAESLLLYRFIPAFQTKTGRHTILNVPQHHLAICSQSQLADQIIAETISSDWEGWHLSISQIPALLDCPQPAEFADPYFIPAPTPPGSASPQAAESSERPVLRVGLSWYQASDRLRGPAAICPITALQPLMGLTHIEWHLLATADGSQHPDCELLGRDLAAVDATSTTNSAQLAQLMQSLDHIVCVESEAAHLAGGVGCPVSVLLPKVGDWPWQADGTRSDWYASATLHRQREWHDWTAPLQQLADELRTLGPRSHTDHNH